MQYDIQDRRKVYSILEREGIEIPRYAVLDRDSPDPKRKKSLFSSLLIIPIRYVQIIYLKFLTFTYPFLAPLPLILIILPWQIMN